MIDTTQMELESLKKQVFRLNDRLNTLISCFNFPQKTEMGSCWCNPNYPSGGIIGYVELWPDIENSNKKIECSFIEENK